MVNFTKKSLKKLYTLFARWWFFLFLFMADIYVWKSKRDENMQDYTQTFFWSFRLSIYLCKSVFSQPVPCKKNGCEDFHIFFQEIFFYYFFLLFTIFLIQKTENVWGFILLMFLRLNVAIYVLKKLQSWNNQSVTNKPNTAKTKNTL